VKFLSADTIGDPHRFCTGAADLVVVSVCFNVDCLAAVNIAFVLLI
jgi:hypothetical protein